MKINSLNLHIYYYEIALVILSIIAYFVIDVFNKKREQPYHKLILNSPLLLIVAIIVARIVYWLSPGLAEGISGFSIAIYFYAIIIISGALLAALLAAREAKNRGLNPEFIWDMLPWLLIIGIIGARLWHVFTPSIDALVDGKNPYFIDPLQIFNFRRGGLGIPGGIIGGALAMWFYCRKKGLNFFNWVDLAVPGVALAQGIGRWGNFFNQELYGCATSITVFPISVNINGSYYLAMFFYEFVWNLLNMALLLWLPRRLGDKMKPGDNFLVYLMVYGIGRFFLEFIRVDYSPVIGVDALNINQIIMGIVVVVASALLISRHVIRNGKSTTAEEAEESK